MSPASGTVSSTGPQSLTPSTPLRLTNADNVTGMTAVPTGLKIEISGTYRLSYSVTVEPSAPASPHTARLFLTLNIPENPISGTALSFSHPAERVEATSQAVMVTLVRGNLIQITPMEITGRLTAIAATLTVEQLP